MDVLPARIDGGDGLVLRAWAPEDADAFSAAVLESREHLLPWLGWVAGEPIGRPARLALIEEFEAARLAGGDAVYGTFLDGQVAGGCGLHRRIGPDALEIGYWTHVAHVRRGLATRVVHALAGAALALPDIVAVEVHHDRANAASAAVARRAGFDFVGERADGRQAPAEEGVEWIWRRER